MTVRRIIQPFCKTKQSGGKSYHKGVFVDIFPGDRVASSGLGRKLQFFACAVNLLYNRGMSAAPAGLWAKWNGFY